MKARWGLGLLEMDTPGGGVKVKSESLTGMFSCMAVKVNSVAAPSTSSRRMCLDGSGGGDLEGQELDALGEAFGDAGDLVAGGVRV